MNVKEHYDSHLGNFYSWMAGDFGKLCEEQEDFFNKSGLKPEQSGLAIDLGAGHGIHSVALARIGYQIKAIDFNRQLLSELKINSKGLNVECIEEDIRSVKKYKNDKPELILCMGDTLTHLGSKEEIFQLMKDCSDILLPKGKLIVSFRNYTSELKGTERLIPVKSDNTKILTCFLEYAPDYVTVTDLLYEKEQTGWEQKVSSYRKVRISDSEVKKAAESAGLKILQHEMINRMITLVCQKT